MQPTQPRMAGGEAPIGKHNKYLGGWGAFGGQKQRGIITYGLSSNQQNPFAGAGHAAIFNTWRRFSNQVLYWAPPMLFFYFTMSWAVERNHYLSSKQGRAELADQEE